METQHSFSTFANFNQRNDEEMSSSFGSSGFASGFSSSYTSASSSASNSSFSSFNSPFNSSASSLTSPSTPTSSTPGRLREWKNRKHREGNNTNSMRNRRDEIVARFRGISLSVGDDDDLVNQNDVASSWGWDDCVNQNWGSDTGEQNRTPWYVFDDSLTWDQFLELSETDRRDRGRQYFHNEMMHDLEEGNDYAKANPWLAKTEFLIASLINTMNPHDMMCPACNHFALIIKFDTLVCTTCLKYYPMAASSNIILMKQGMKRFENKHALQCPRPSASYGIYNGDIAIICDYCQLMYNVSRNF